MKKLNAYTWNIWVIMARPIVYSQAVGRVELSPVLITTPIQPHVNN